MGYFGNLQVKKPDQFDGQLQVATPTPQPRLTVAPPVQQPNLSGSMPAPPPMPQPRLTMAPPPQMPTTPDLPSPSANPGGGTFSTYRNPGFQHIPNTHSLLNTIGRFTGRVYDGITKPIEQIPADATLALTNLGAKAVGHAPMTAADVSHNPSSPIYNSVKYAGATGKNSQLASDIGQGALDVATAGVDGFVAQGASKLVPKAAPAIVKGLAHVGSNIGTNAAIGSGYGVLNLGTEGQQFSRHNIQSAAEQGAVGGAVLTGAGEAGAKLVSKGADVIRSAKPLDERGSIGRDAQGKPLVNVDTAQHIFDNKPVEAYPSIARKYLNDNFKGQTFATDEGGNITVGGRGIGKFTAPNDRLTPNMIEAKMRLAPELPNAIKISKEVSSATDKGGKHGAFAKDGFKYHNFDFNVNGQRFRGTFNVGKNGEINNFYDVHPIKELPNGSSNLSGSPIQQNGPTASPEGLPSSILPPNEPKVNLNPNTSRGFIIKEGPLVSGKRDVVRVRLNPETKQLEQHIESVDAPIAQTRQISENQGPPLYDDPSHSSLSSELQSSPQTAEITPKEQTPLKESNNTNPSNNYTPDVKDEVQSYADVFGITRHQALEDLRQMQLNKAKIHDLPEGVTPPPTIEERRQIIRDNPKQQETVHQIDLGVESGNIKGAIAKALAKSEDRNKFVKDAALKVNKLNDDDKHLFYQWEDGANIDDLLEYSHHPNKLRKAIESDVNAFDYHLALDRASGGSTLRQGNYGLPKYFKATEEQMNKMEIPENQRFKKGNYTGFHDTSAKYHSYLDAYRRGGLEPLYDNPAEAIMKYHDQGAKSMRDQALYTALAKAAPDHVAPLDVTSDASGRQFTQAAGKLPFAASKEMQKSLKAFGSTWKSDNAIVDKVIFSGLAANSKAKASLFFGAPFHYFNGYSRFVGLTAGSGHGLKLGRGTVESFGSAIIPGVNRSIKAKAERDGVLQYIKENGGVLHDTGRPQHVGGGVMIKLKDAAGTVSPFRLTNVNMSAFFDTMMINLGRALKNKGIESGSIEAQQAMAEYNRILGHFNARVEGGDPNVAKILSGEALAPHWLRTQFGMIKDAGKYSLPDKGVLGKVGFEGTAKHGFGMYNAGDIARTTLIGTRLAQGAFATIVTAIAMGEAPTLKSLTDRFGAKLSNPVPSIDLGEKDKKGRHQVIDLPTDPTGLAIGLATDPKHFTQSRFSPLISTGERFATNQDWNGNPLSDPNSPNALQDRVKGSLKGALPIGLQNFTNPNITTNQGLIQEVGGRVKTDPNDPQSVATKQYFDTKKQLLDDLAKGNYAAIDPSLKGLDKKAAQDFVNKYNAMHPAATKDITGTSLPKSWDADSGSERKNNYTANDPKTGKQVLSPAFYIDKKLASFDPSRPHSALFDLNGTAMNPDNPKENIPKAQIALNYAASGDTGEKAVIMQREPWLKDYEKKSIAEAKNYVPLLTAYMQKEGWTKPVIDDYWAKHPNNQGPIQAPPISDALQAKLDNLDTLDDPADAAQYMKDNPDLGIIFAQMHEYSNKMRAAKGQLEYKGSPQPTPDVKAILESMSKGNDKASRKFNAQLMEAHPEVRDYLADASAHKVEFEGAKARFVGEDFNSKALKGIQQFGKYSIVKNADGTYSQVAGHTADGTALAATGQAFTPGLNGSSAAYLKENPKALAASKNTLDPAAEGGRHGHAASTHAAHARKAHSKFMKTKRIKIKKVRLVRVRAPKKSYIGKDMKVNLKHTSGKMNTKIKVKPIKVKLGISPQK